MSAREHSAPNRADAEPIALRVPKSMPPENVVWAFRHGVIWGLRRSGRVLPNAGHGYVQAPRNVLQLADRVTREVIRRHREVLS